MLDAESHKYITWAVGLLVALYILMTRNIFSLQKSVGGMRSIADCDDKVKGYSSDLKDETRYLEEKLTETFRTISNERKEEIKDLKADVSEIHKRIDNIGKDS